MRRPPTSSRAGVALGAMTFGFLLGWLLAPEPLPPAPSPVRGVSGPEYRDLSGGGLRDRLRKDADSWPRLLDEFRRDAPEHAWPAGPHAGSRVDARPPRRDVVVSEDLSP